jgi:hypothetical protein
MCYTSEMDKIKVLLFVAVAVGAVNAGYASDASNGDRESFKPVPQARPSSTGPFKMPRGFLGDYPSEGYERFQMYPWTMRVGKRFSLNQLRGWSMPKYASLIQAKVQAPAVFSASDAEAFLRGETNTLKGYDSCADSVNGWVYGVPPYEAAKLPSFSNASHVNEFPGVQPSTLNRFDSHGIRMNDLIWQSKDGWGQINDYETNF